MNKDVIKTFLLEEEDIEEAIPGDLAKAYDNAGLNRSYRSQSYTPDYQAADYTALTPEEALQALKTTPTKVVAIIRDRRDRPRAVKFGPDGRTRIDSEGPGAFRFDVKEPYINKRGRNKGEPRYDIHYLPTEYLLSIADKIYLTNEVDTPKNSAMIQARAQNIESPHNSSKLKNDILYGGDNDNLTAASKWLTNNGVSDDMFKQYDRKESRGESEISTGISFTNGKVNNQYSYGGTYSTEEWLSIFAGYLSRWGWSDSDTQHAWESYLLGSQAGNRDYHTPTVGELKRLFKVDDSRKLARLRYADVEQVLKAPIEKAKEAIGEIKDLERQSERVTYNRDEFASPSSRTSRESNITYWIRRYKDDLLRVLSNLEEYENQLDDLDASDMAKIKEFDDKIADLQSKITAAKANLPQNKQRGAIFGNANFDRKVPESLEENKSLAELVDIENGRKHNDPLDESPAELDRLMNFLDDDEVTDELNEALGDDKVDTLAQYLEIDPSEIKEVAEDEFETPEGDYLVLTEDEAHNRAAAEIRMSFDDMGLEAFTPDFQKWIVENALSDDAVNEFIDEEIDYFTNQEEDQDVLNTLTGLETKEDKVEYIRSVFGDLSDFVKPDNIDIDTVADEAIKQDGVAHFIAYYDGDECNLGNGLYGYRVN